MSTRPHSLSGAFKNSHRNVAALLTLHFIGSPCITCAVYVSVVRGLTALCDTAACLDIKIMVMLWKTVSR